MKQEIWKKIENYQNYEISNFGNVRKILKQTFTIDGYKSIGLVDEFGKSKTFRVHKLVAEAFIENENIDRTMINHKNSIRYDNNIDNLEWCTAKENSFHAVNVLKRKLGGNFRHGKIAPNRLPVIQYTLNGIEVDRYLCIADAAKKFNGTYANISNHIRGKTKTAFGFKWKYA